MNYLNWISVDHDIARLLIGVHFKYMLILTYDLQDQMNSDFDKQDQFEKLKLSNLILKKFTFSFECEILLVNLEVSPTTYLSFTVVIMLRTNIQIEVSSNILTSNCSPRL